jgi:pyrimidine-nucleoside phosphorylase
MRAYDVIRKKREGNELTSKEISFILSPDVPDYQVSAFLMAVYLKGMTDKETVALTRAMMHSGTVLDLGGISAPKVDKHSTGGVGDKTSIILAPLMATMGVKVPMISGRGLGHTGGTLDKLESMPGLRTDITADEFMENVKTVGMSIMGQSEDLVPADRRLYGLRDVTATVESIPLIASSIMSKKLASGIGGLVLDVKTGAGAFMKSLKDAEELARTMVKIGNSMGVMTAAVITDMQQPLGKTVGNSLELKECISALRGGGGKDLMEVTLTLAAWMLNITDALSEEVPLKKMSGQTIKKYIHETMDFLDKGDAFKKFVEFVDAQHGDPEAAFTPGLLPSAAFTRHIKAEKDGAIRRLDAEAVGTASMLLGAGRKKAGDTVDHSAGIILNRKMGDEVKAGEPVAMLHSNDEALFKDAEDVFLSGLEIGKREKAARRLIHKVIME